MIANFLLLYLGSWQPFFFSFFFNDIGASSKRVTDTRQRALSTRQKTLQSLGGCRAVTQRKKRRIRTWTGGEKIRVLEMGEGHSSGLKGHRLFELISVYFLLRLLYSLHFSMSHSFLGSFFYFPAQCCPDCFGGHPSSGEAVGEIVDSVLLGGES